MDSFKVSSSIGWNVVSSSTPSAKTCRKLETANVSPLKVLIWKLRKRSWKSVRLTIARSSQNCERPPISKLSSYSDFTNGLLATAGGFGARLFQLGSRLKGGAL